MNDVDLAKLDQSLEQSFKEGQLPFCHDKQYRLKYADRWLCSLNQAEHQRCPALKQQCGVAIKPEPDSDKSSGSMHAAPWVGALAEGLFWLLIAALVAAVVVAILRIRLARQSNKDEVEERTSLEPPPGDAAPPPISGDKDVQRLLDKARRAADRGELGAAIDAAHAAAVQGLSATGHVEVDRDRTNGDYLRDLRKAPPLQQQFKAIVGRVEVAQFGGVAPTRSAFDQVLEQVMSLLRRLAVLSLWLMLTLGVLGCGARKSAESEDVSPSGLYTLRRLLTDQGSKVHMRVAPLSKLANDVGVLVIYATELEEAEQKHVLSWVREGGSLVVVGNSDLTEAGDVEVVPHACGHVAERGPGQELAPLKLAVVGEQSLRVTSDPESEVAQHVDVTCGGSPYIVTSFLDDGQITFIPERELLSNASLSIADNARLVAELLSDPESTIELVGPWTGDGSQSPVQSLRSAGLLPVMLQLLGLALLLAVRQGTSFGVRRDVQKLERRAFADHVRAVGSNYARANAGRLAAGHYGLLLVDQLRERTCPGQRPTLLQLAAVVARRVRRPETEIVQLLVEAKTAFDDQIDGQGVNHKLIRELEQLSLQAGGVS
jgi:hypothetical protein